MKRIVDTQNENARNDNDLLEFILREQENYPYLGKLHSSLYAIAAKKEDSSEHTECLATMHKDMEYVYTEALKRRDHVVIIELKKSPRFDSKFNEIKVVDNKSKTPRKKAAKSRLALYEQDSEMQSPLALQDMNITPPSSPIKVTRSLIAPTAPKVRSTKTVAATQGSVRTQIVMQRPQIALDKTFEQALMMQTKLDTDEIASAVIAINTSIDQLLQTTDLTLPVYRAHLQINMSAALKYSNAQYGMGLHHLKLQYNLPADVATVMSIYACAMDVKVNPTLLYALSKSSPESCKEEIQDFGSKIVGDFLRQLYPTVELYKAMRGF